MIISDQLIDEAMHIYGLTHFNRPLYRYNSIQSPWQRSTGTSIKFSLLAGGLLPTCDFFEIFSWLGTSIYTHHQFHSIMFTGLQIQQWRVTILNIKIKTIGFLWDIKNLSCFKLAYIMNIWLRFLSVYTSSTVCSNSYPHLF